LGLANHLPEGAASTAAEWARASAERAGAAWRDSLAWLDGKFNREELSSRFYVPLNGGGLHLGDEDSLEATSL
jgi:hypothetical protein